MGKSNPRNKHWSPSNNDSIIDKKKNILYIVGRWNTTFSQDKYTLTQDTLISSRILNITKIKTYIPRSHFRKTKYLFLGQINTVWRIKFYLDIWTVKNQSPLWDPIAVPTARCSDNSIVRQLDRVQQLFSQTAL